MGSACRTVRRQGAAQRYRGALWPCGLPATSRFTIHASKCRHPHQGSAGTLAASISSLSLRLNLRASAARLHLARAWVHLRQPAAGDLVARRGAPLSAVAAAAATGTGNMGDGKRPLEGGAEGGPAKKAAGGKPAVNPKRVRELRKGAVEGSGPVIYWCV